jgi:ABC-type sugar transport system ATPase subunit
MTLLHLDREPSIPHRAKGGITLRGVGKCFGKTVALDDVDLTIAPGEAVAIVGPSGSGKSTLLRIIAGLEEPGDGEVEIGGATMDGIPARRRDVAMVFQSFALYPHLTVFRNLALPLELRAVPRAEIERRVGQAAEMLDIAYLLNRKPGPLSGGQRQRVALARAIVRNPATFLFDEPLSNLDAQHRAELRREIVALHRRSGASLVLVTHDQADAMTIADRIIVMREGRIVQTGAPEDTLDPPEHLSVRRHLHALRGAPN